MNTISQALELSILLFRAYDFTQLFPLFDAVDGWSLVILMEVFLHFGDWRPHLCAGMLSVLVYYGAFDQPF